MKKKVREALQKAKHLEKKPFPTEKEIEAIFSDLRAQEEKLHKLMYELSRKPIETQKRRISTKKRSSPTRKTKSL